MRLTLPTHTQKLLGGHQSKGQRLFGLCPCHLLTLFPPLPFSSFCLTSVSIAFLTHCPSFFVWQIQGSFHTLCNPSEGALPLMCSCLFLLCSQSGDIRVLSLTCLAFRECPVSPWEIKILCLKAWYSRGIFKCFM